MSLILIVDDVPAMRDQYAYDLQRLGGYETRTAEGGEAALEILKQEPVDCVILDLEMPGLDGFAVLRELREGGLQTPVIVYTGTGSYDRCVRAVKLGAYSFLDKSESMEKVAQEVANALERGRLLSEVRMLRRQVGEESRMVGESPPLLRLREEIARVAPIPSPVLILGESGSGKELVARDIHAQSGRGEENFLAINCAALPENLVESELFGHEAGAFTGAKGARKGAFESADGGTLLLDEVGELPLPAQSKLLRILEDGEVTRVGGTRTVKVDTRVLAATNRDLEAEVSERRFRQDLLYRINVHQLVVPPLRERLSDVPLLVEHFLDLICGKFGVRRKSMSTEAVRRLAAGSWERNNVRELRNIVERMILATDGPEISLDAIPPEIGGRSRPAFVPAGASRSLKDQKEDAERRIVLDALERNEWQITRTASELGLSDHSSLLKIMRRHNLKRPK
jgi:two-component system nitrogen regulation response regulator NtrX